ncbi:MAG: polysaccharide deacetylase family protein [Treponema sp.]|nr:polysaccharide deacetylase family protein [Treponema sp.]
MFFAPLRLPAKVVFSGLNLSDDNRLLFRAGSEGDGSHVQDVLFLSRLTDLTLKQMTAFPEELELLENGRTLQVRNAFGAMRLPLSGGLPQGIPGFPAFAGGVPPAGGRVEGMASSADGKWILVIDPVSPAYGDLVLIDTLSGNRSVISYHVERPDKGFPACWSPDSRVFVYNRGGQLYYYTVNASSAPVVDERYRLVGEGAIGSVVWSGTGDFFYLRGSTVYRVRGSELFARAIYADFLEIGTVAGNIPFDFDPAFDAFWISPDSRFILLSKGRRNMFYYPLEPDDYHGGYDFSLPYLMIPRSCFALKVLWSPGGVVTVIASVLEEEGTGILAYRLSSGSGEMTFVPLASPVGSGGALSPDGNRALFWGEGGIVLYDYVNWRPLATISTRPAFSCLWVGNNEFIAGDEGRIEGVRLSGERWLICLSSAGEFGFEERGGRILAKNGGAWFVSDGNSSWTETANPSLRGASQVSGRYRVYLEKQSSGLYENLPMIRNTASVGTSVLLPGFTGLAPAEESFGTGGAPASPDLPGLFSYGRRGGAREAALCFDLYDDITGLPEVLDALNRFGVRATFFLNGEFIRRHPTAAWEISKGGHETASMFFAPIDLSDARYRIGDDFISRGLARNEDEFYRASGEELNLLWHPPYYAASAEIISAAAGAGYKTIGRDVDPMDWVRRDDVYRIGLYQDSAADMINRIMETKQPGSIIPVRLGLLPGGRQDYLFSRINVLLDALVRSGYSLVPVSTLMEHSR